MSLFHASGLIGAACMANLNDKFHAVADALRAIADAATAAVPATGFPPADTGLLPPAPWAVLAAFAFAFGACIGSFLNVCIYRTPLGLSVVRPRSHCMACNSEIPWYHNIPIASYFVLGGRCAKCGARFSFRYAAVEMLVGLLFLAVFCAWPAAGAAPPFGIAPIHLPVAPDGHVLSLRPLWLVPLRWFALSGLVAGAFIDLDHFILPDTVTIGGMIAGLALSALVPETQARIGLVTLPGGMIAPWTLVPTTRFAAIAQSALGLCAGYALLETIRRVGTFAMQRLGRIGPDDEAMGFGDVKLLAAIGAFFGWQCAVFSLVAGAFSGVAAALPMLALAKRNGHASAEAAPHSPAPPRIPFGPFLATGAAIWMFWGRRLVAAWLWTAPPWAQIPGI